MPNLNLFDLIFIVVPATTATVALLLYYLEREKTRRLKVANPQKVIREAMRKGLEIVEASKSETKGFEVKYDTQMHKLLKDMESGFNHEISKAEKEYVNYLLSLREQSQQMQEDSQKLLAQQSKELLAKLETGLTTSLDKEVANSRELIESYKQSQLKVVDENIIAMLEKTLSLVLAKKITLKDELDLVYEALDKAKAEKFIV